MSEGVFAVHRGVFEHALFDGQPYSERDAWLWLVAQAAWKPRRVKRIGSIIEIGRGQLCHSERFLANAWLWTKSKVHRFLGRLKREGMIELKSDRETNLITICNYDRYAFDGTSKRTASEPPANQERTKLEEGKKEKKERIDISDWRPNEKHMAIAISLKVDIRDIEETFRDYVANHPRKYRDFDAAFRQFLKNAPKFNGVQHGKATGNILPAADRLIDRVRAFDRAPELRSGEGASVVRLLPKG